VGLGLPKSQKIKKSVADYPQLVKEWHPTKNRPLTPSKVTAGSEKHVWWKCPEGPDHEWQARVADRSRGRGCPFCAGKKVSVTNSLATLFPELANEWHPTKNGTLTPDKVTAGSHKKVWWQRPENPDHEWQARVDSRTNREKIRRVERSKKPMRTRKIERSKKPMRTRKIEKSKKPKKPVVLGPYAPSVVLELACLTCEGHGYISEGEHCPACDGLGIRLPDPSKDDTDYEIFLMQTLSREPYSIYYCLLAQRIRPRDELRAQECESCPNYVANDGICDPGYGHWHCARESSIRSPQELTPSECGACPEFAGNNGLCEPREVVSWSHYPRGLVTSKFNDDRSDSIMPGQLKQLEDALTSAKEHRSPLFVASISQRLQEALTNYLEKSWLAALRAGLQLATQYAIPLNLGRLADELQGALTYYLVNDQPTAVRIGLLLTRQYEIPLALEQLADELRDALVSQVRLGLFQEVKKAVVLAKKMGIPLDAATFQKFFQEPLLFAVETSFIGRINSALAFAIEYKIPVNSPPWVNRARRAFDYYTREGRTTELTKLQKLAKKAGINIDKFDD
jgi:hypothetical protein